MKIGIDCRTMSSPRGQVAGIGHYTSGLVSGLVQQFKEDQFVLFVDHHGEENERLRELEQLSHVTVVRFPFSEHKRYLPLVHSHWMVARMLKRHRLDVFHAPANIVPLGYSGKSVATIHDLAIFEHPEWFPDKQLLARTVLLPKTAEKATRLIAVSEATRKQIEEHFEVGADRTVVIPEAADHVRQIMPQEQRAVRDRFGLDGPYVLFVGTIEPRKNVARLIRAFNALLENHPHLATTRLVLTGKRGWKHKDVTQELEAIAHRDRVVELGYVTDAEKAALLAGARMCAFPSLDEGFGLPVLEAYQYGVPVVTSARGSLEEVGGPGAIFVDPEDVHAIADGLFQLLSDDQLRDSMGRAGQEHGAEFTWERVARETHAVYNQVVQE